MKTLAILRHPGSHLREKFAGEFVVKTSTLFSCSDENHLTRDIRRRTVVGIRFGQKVEVQQNGCWKWTGATNDAGRPVVGLAGRTRLATHVCLALVGVRIPKGRSVRHTCGAQALCDSACACANRLCVNPSHLRVVTSDTKTTADGIGRRGSNHNAAKTECVHGHSLADAYIHASTRHGRKYMYRYCRQCRTARNRRLQQVDVDPMDVQILRDRGYSPQKIASELTTTVAVINRMT